MYRTLVLLPPNGYTSHSHSTNTVTEFFQSRCKILIFFAKNVVYFIMLSFLVYKVFTFYIRGVLKLMYLLHFTLLAYDNASVENQILTSWGHYIC
jgi:hypothetical protein